MNLFAEDEVAEAVPQIPQSSEEKIERFECQRVFDGHTDSVTGAIALKNRRLLSWGWDRTLRLWNEETGELLATLEGHTGPVNGAIPLKDQRLLSWANDDNTLRLWGEKIVELERNL